jgi:protein-tyrosine phosphatase
MQQSSRVAKPALPMPPIVFDIRNAEDARDVVHRAVQALAEGKIVAFPTETVYGIGASACRPDAVERLLEIKNRPNTSPFALAIKSAEEAHDYVPDMSPLARRLARRCWPGPVTLVVDGNHRDGLTERLPGTVKQVVAPNGAIGLRVPKDGILQDVLRMLAGPIVLTSANRSGEKDSITAEDVLQALGSDVAMVLDEGACHFGQPSTVLRIRNNTFEILREGVVSEATLRGFAKVLVLFVCTGNTCRSPMAELLMRGQLAQRLGCKIEELGEKGFVVKSAGVKAAAGCPPSVEAVQVMREWNLDLATHKAQPLTEKLVRDADLILPMTQNHLQAIIDGWPTAADRTRLVLPDKADVADPIGQTIAAYRHCAEQIDAGVRHHRQQLDRELGM